MIGTVARAFTAALVFGITFPAGALMFSGALLLSKPTPEKPIPATGFELPTVAPSGKPIRVVTVETTSPSPARQAPIAPPAITAPPSVAPAPLVPVATPAAPAPGAASPAAPVVSAKGESCRRDSERLAKLRADPNLAEVQRFSRELGCDGLRPQIARLLESLGAAEVATVAPAAARPQAPASAAPEQSPQAPTAKGEVCQRDSELLARLRANPTLEGAERFSRELACESLRVQASRLLESLGG